MSNLVLFFVFTSIKCTQWPDALYKLFFRPFTMADIQYVECHNIVWIWLEKTNFLQIVVVVVVAAVLWLFRFNDSTWHISIPKWNELNQKKKFCLSSTKKMMNVNRNKFRTVTTKRIQPTQVNSIQADESKATHKKMHWIGKRNKEKMKIKWKMKKHLNDKWNATRHKLNPWSLLQQNYVSVVTV